MNEPRVLQDIKNQGESLACVLRQQSVEQRQTLSNISGLIRTARKIIITGMGASLYAALPLHYQLSAMGLQSSIIDSAELLHYQLPVCAGGLVILVSRSGESVELVKLLPKLKKMAVRTIAVANEPASTLAAEADVVQIVGSLQDESMAIQSYTGTLLALMLLASDVAGEFEQAFEEAESLPEVVLRLVNDNLEDPLPWEAFLTPELPVYLLGRGPSYASALEGALLFNETAKHPAIAMAAGNFRHGHVEVVDSSFRGLVFSPLGNTRELNLALAGNLQGFGGKVLVIGPSDENLPGLHCIDLPALSERFAPIVEIIPVQFIALRLAEQKDLPVGKLRYIAQVTTDEMVF